VLETDIDDIPTETQPVPPPRRSTVHAPPKPPKLQPEKTKNFEERLTKQTEFVADRTDQSQRADVRIPPSTASRTPPINRVQDTAKSPNKHGRSKSISDDHSYRTRPAREQDQLNKRSDSFNNDPPPYRKPESSAVSPPVDMTVKSHDPAAHEVVPIRRSTSFGKKDRRESRRSSSKSSDDLKEAKRPSPASRLPQRETEFSVEEDPTPKPAERHHVSSKGAKPVPFDRYSLNDKKQKSTSDILAESAANTAASLHERSGSAELLEINSRSECSPTSRMQTPSPRLLTRSYERLPPSPTVRTSPQPMRKSNAAASCERWVPCCKRPSELNI